MTAETPRAFLSFVESPSRVPAPVWVAARLVALAAFVAVIVGGFVAPDDTLTVFWGLLVPSLPMVWMLAPGLWRNTCPLATVNQIPRVFGFSRAGVAPEWFRTFSYTIAAAVFVLAVLTRKVVFNDHGAGVSLLLIAVVGLAFAGGVAFQGKSGWCSAVCPLLPVQRLYGQAPVGRIANAHCDPCVGCTKNCFDFNPGVAYVADMHDPDQRFRGQRHVFAGAFPGLVIAFFEVGSADEIGVWQMYAQSLLWITGGIALFRVLQVYLPGRRNAVPPVFGAVGFVLFYWYGAPRMTAALDVIVESDWDWLRWPLRLAAIAVAINFVWRAHRTEEWFVRETEVEITARAHVPDSALSGGSGEPSVKFLERDDAVDAPNHPTVLEVAEASGVAISSGCRMGVCGADPVAIVTGAGNLTPALPAEVKTLTRLGLGPPNRMACMARVVGPCTVSTAPDTAGVPVPTTPTFDYDRDVERVVIVGNGIAGVTAADHVRRNHPDCTIDVIAREAHPLYNRMGISHLIDQPKGVSSLTLLQADWYERNQVTTWLNTNVISIDRDAHDIELGTGHRLGYDRLILATGSSAMVPPISGFGTPGCFSVRLAEHAVRIRAYAQEPSCRRAFVAGGGLLGLEAAFSLHQLGLVVTVGERSARLLRRQVDERASEILLTFFEHVGMTVRTEVEVAAVHGEGRVEAVETTGGDMIETDLLVVAAGVVPNAELATTAGLDVHRGVVVDDAMRTSDPDIFAVGDLAEHDGRIWGLWAVATAQAEVAAMNAVGADEVYVGDIPTTILKGAGIDMTSFGRVDPDDGDDVTIEADGIDPFEYVKVVRRDGRVVGGIFVNAAERAVEVQALYESAHSAAVHA